ncbi:hypothetical protein Dimus_011480 [Dionaea muscipula]
MALRRAAGLGTSTTDTVTILLGLGRLIHGLPLPPPACSAIDPLPLPPLKLPETGFRSESGSIGFQLPDFVAGGGSMELMAVPKKKVSRHKRGIRNGPKALKPIPVIIRCKGCGRVKLPHYYCCSGRRDDADEKAGSSN